MEYIQRFFRPYIWSNRLYKHLSFLVEGTVVAATADLEAENICIPGGMVVEVEVDSGGVNFHRCIRLVRWSGGDAIICFFYAHPK